MYEIFRDFVQRFVIVYIDDILIYSETLEEHVEQVKQVLERLQEHHLYVKGEKSEFHRGRVSFLGFILSSEDIQMDEGKVPAVLKWPLPKSVKDLQRFLGLANYYRRFILNFSQVAAALTSLLMGHKKKLAWERKAQESFETLKNSFCSAPILKQPDGNLPFEVEVDALETGVGAVLSQRQGSPPKLYPCAFFSKKLSSAEQNYDVGERELLL